MKLIYGNKLYLPQDYKSSGAVANINNFYPNTKTARVFIPASVTTKGFVGSHSILNYGWIFTTRLSGMSGYVKPR